MSKAKNGERLRAKGVECQGRKCGGECRRAKGCERREVRSETPEMRRARSEKALRTGAKSGRRQRAERGGVMANRSLEVGVVVA